MIDHALEPPQGLRLQHLLSTSDHSDVTWLCTLELF